MTTHTIRIESLDAEVECREDQNILDACLRNGVWLPHACTHGTCGTCKVEIVEGDVNHQDASEFALMEYERNEGKTLVCVATPESDVTIEADVEAEEGVTMHPVRDFTGVVNALEDCARETRRITIDLDDEIGFNAGQYVQVTLPNTAGEFRSWSMANSPANGKQIELAVRRTPGGKGTDGWIFKDLKVGDEVKIAGPYGRFFVRTAKDKPIIMIGGGTGLSPLKSMVTHVLEEETGQVIHLYHGVRVAEDLYDVEYFRQLQAEHEDQFFYHPCLSEEEGVEDTSFGLVTDVIDNDFKTLRGMVAYICGPPAMVEASLKMLMKKRLFPRDTYREDFFDSSDKETGGTRSPLMRTN
ncbi:MAG: 2Fe-2S iron-sulfur cluster-binding protein [Propionibacteriaceae bacterium]|nr:2Fe-2S iron-sulfur cluster-binding protein [Propionibacteriaceae bacterium]